MATEAASAASALKVVDLGLGMAAALVAKQFAELGAQVLRIEPDAGDPFYDVYPAYGFWRRGAALRRDAELDDLLADADVCILGGEDFPGLDHPGDAEAFSRGFPRLVVLHLGGGESDAPAVDLLVQARTGLVFEQSAERPTVAGFAAPTYGAAYLGLIGAWAALVERERSGRGQIVRTAMTQGAAVFWGPFWMKAQNAERGFDITPRDARPLIVQCADGAYLQFCLGTPGSVAKAYGAFGIPDAVDPLERGLPDHKRGPARFFGDVELFDRYAKAHRREALVAALRDAGIPCEPVLQPGENWDDPQVEVNGIIETGLRGDRGVANPIRLCVAGGSSRPNPALPAPNGAPPLHGFRILDCGVFVAGPYASKLLADCGAEVIRVDPPAGRSTLSGERTIIVANHGKRYLSADLKTASGRALAAELCRSAHAVVHNFRLGVSARLGLDRDTLRAINPGLVILETSAYGAVGPKASSPGFDMIMQACSGLEARAGGKGEPPVCSRSPLVDFATGAVGAVGLLVGLYEVLRTGRAVAVETSLLDVSTHMMSELVQAADGTWLGAPPLDRRRTGFHPAEALYRAADGWIAVAARSDAMAAAFAAALALDLPPSRAAWGEGERDRIAAALAPRRRGDVLAALRKAGVWAEACIEDGWSRGTSGDAGLEKCDDPVLGEVIHRAGAGISFSRSATRQSRRLVAPAGADTALILEELKAPART